MSLFEKAKNLVKRLTTGNTESKKSFLPKDKILVLRHDGSWVLNDTKVPPTAPLPQPKPSPWYSYGPLDPVVQTIDQVPDFHPDAEDLNKKLNDCMAANVITACLHSVDYDSIYTLSIELPTSGETTVDANQINAFIHAMQLKYNLKLARKERVSSKTTHHTFNILVFEYVKNSNTFK